MPGKRSRRCQRSIYCRYFLQDSGHEPATKVHSLGGIEFPSDQPNRIEETYFTADPTPGQTKGVITPEVMNGTSKVVFLYCIQYESSGIPHHTAFGYFFQSKHIRPNHLGIVEIGNDAD
jgi:hypothetical protein